MVASISQFSRLLFLSLLVFVLTASVAAADEVVLHRFAERNDAHPSSPLVVGPDGDLYGVAAGAQSPGGAVFKMHRTPDGRWNETILHAFGATPNDGSFPEGGLTFDKAGNIYGTTEWGGAFKYGTVYKLTRNRNDNWNEKVLYSFINGSDGAMPASGVVFDQFGDLWGTTLNGGAWGTIFELLPTGGEWELDTIFDFNGSWSGANPFGQLRTDAHGNIWGTTADGGNGGGVVFEVSHSQYGWSVQIVYSFPNCCDASHPYYGPLVFDNSGNVYGASAGGGQYGYGAVFKLTETNGGWSETVVYSFLGQDDGAYPYGGLTFVDDNHLIGVTIDRGKKSFGTIFELIQTNNTWAATVLHSFDFVDGASASNALLRWSDRTLFGVTFAGGVPGCNLDGCGVFFELNDSTASPPEGYPK